MKRFRISFNGSSILVVGSEKDFRLFEDNEWSYVCYSIDAYITFWKNDAEMNRMDILIEEV